jgi:hypothetical protein
LALDEFQESRKGDSEEGTTAVPYTPGVAISINGFKVVQNWQSKTAALILGTIFIRKIGITRAKINRNLSGECYQ